IFGGLAVSHDYLVAIPVGLLVLLCVALERPSREHLRLAAIGFAPFAVLLVVYNWAAFGEIITSPHQHEAKVTFMTVLGDNFRTPVLQGIYLNLFSTRPVPASALSWLIARPDAALQMGVEWALKTTYKGLFIQSPFLLLAVAGWFVAPRVKLSRVAYPG